MGFAQLWKRAELPVPTANRGVQEPLSFLLD